MVIYGRLKTKENFNILALKVTMVAYERRSLRSVQDTVGPPLSGHSLGQDNWPLNRGSYENSVMLGPVFSLPNISTDNCKGRKSRTNDGCNMIHNISRSQRNNYVSTLTFFYLHLAKNVLLQIFQAVYYRYKTTPNHLGTVMSWRQPLDRGDRWIEVFITV